MFAHDKLDELHRSLLDRQIIEIGGEIDRAMVLYVREAILRLTGKGSPPITVYITSSGGSVSVGLDIYDILQGYPGEKTGIVQGFAESMAAVVLQACNKRHAARHASLLIHHVSMTQVSLDKFRSKTATEKIIRDLEADQSRLYEILAKRTGKPVRIIRRECAKNRPMTSPEALKFGLIDKVV